VLAWVANLLLIPVLTFYFLRDWDWLVARVRALLPRPVEPTVSRLARESDEMLGGFLRGQLSVMVSLGAVYATGLWLAGIDLALLIGMLAGLVSFVPYLGFIVGAGVALVAALVQHGDWLHVLLVIGVFSVGQVLESFVLTPWLVGDRIGLHPVAVIFAVMAGGQLFGFLGVLLALPVAAVVMVLLRYAHQRYTASGLYGGAAPALAGGTHPRPAPGAGDQVATLGALVASARAAAVVAAPAPGADPGDAPPPAAPPAPPAAS
jgi:predicted PurR-regulated permease PerM